MRDGKIYNDTGATIMDMARLAELPAPVALGPRHKPIPYIDVATNLVDAVKRAGIELIDAPQWAVGKYRNVPRPDGSVVRVENAEMVGLLNVRGGGLPGLEKVFLEEFPNARVQRCQVHVARNVLAKVPKKLKKTIADEVRSIFYATSRKKALEFFEQLKSRWEKDLPSAVKCLANSLESCLTYLHFPEEEWICLRTTNVIERVNKEFKRRTKPMEIVAGERACYTLLAFVCLKMELHWRSKPIGKVPNNLPFLQRLAEDNFTQNR